VEVFPNTVWQRLNSCKCRKITKSGLNFPNVLTILLLSTRISSRIRNAGIHLIVCVDSVAASGGYMMASVADKIYAGKQINSHEKMIF
jgi:hypothetical protein